MRHELCVRERSAEWLSGTKKYTFNLHRLRWIVSWWHFLLQKMKKENEGDREQESGYHSPGKRDERSDRFQLSTRWCDTKCDVVKWQGNIFNIKSSNKISRYNNKNEKISRSGNRRGHTLPYSTNLITKALILLSVSHCKLAGDYRLIIITHKTRHFIIQIIGSLERVKKNIASWIRWKKRDTRHPSNDDDFR